MLREKKKLCKNTETSKTTYEIKNVEFEHKRGVLFSCSYDIEISTRLFLFSEKKWRKSQKFTVGILYMAGTDGDGLEVFTPKEINLVHDTEVRLFWHHLSCNRARLKNIARRFGFPTL
jgi:hypothetical protein